MNSLIIFVVGLSMACSVMAYPHGCNFLDENGQQYKLVEHSGLIRNKRCDCTESKQDTGHSTSLGVNNYGELDLAHKANVFDSNHHSVDATAFAARDFKGGPLTTGGTAEYTHKQSNHGASLTHSNTRGGGTDVNAAANYNLFTSPDGKTSAKVTAEYDRHFGGPGGTGDPNYGVYLKAEHRFQ